MVAIAGLGFGGTSASAKTYIVKFHTDQQLTQAYATKSFFGGTLLDRHMPGHLLKIAFNGESKDTAVQLRSLAAMEGVEYAVEDFALKMFDAPPSPISLQTLSDQWSLEKVHVADAWRIGPGSKKIVVAVIDTGVDISHKDLAGNIYANPGEIPNNGIDDDGNGFVDDTHGWNFIDNSNDIEDVVEAGSNPGHGTHCSGIIGSIGKDGGTLGINQHVSVMPLRFIGPSGQGDLFAALKAIDYAILMNVDVISASWGAQTGAAQAQPLIEAIGRANDAGIIFVAAAGNDGGSNDEVETYPANAHFPNVVSVAASDRNDARPFWSNYGRKKVSIAAPGADILSTLPHDMFGALSGTSMAAPLVAGLFGLLKADAMEKPRSEQLSPKALIALVQSTGADVAIESACMCRIDAGAAASALAANKLILVPAVATLPLGSTLQLAAVGGQGPYTYASSNIEIFTVGTDGLLTAKSTGSASITVTDAHGATTAAPHFIAEAGDGSQAAH